MPYFLIHFTEELVPFPDPKPFSDFPDRKSWHKDRKDQLAPCYERQRQVHDFLVNHGFRVLTVSSSVYPTVVVEAPEKEAIFSLLCKTFTGFVITDDKVLDLIV